MIELVISALIGLISGLLSLYWTLMVMLGGIAGGDIFHPDSSTDYWWVVPIAFLILDVLLVLGIQKFSRLHFAPLHYGVLLTFYIAVFILSLLNFR